MLKRETSMILPVLLVLLAPATATSTPTTCTVNAAGGADYTTIQAAVNNAGCLTINVAAGTYNEHVTIGRSVTINGAGPSSSATIVDGSASGLPFAVSS